MGNRKKLRDITLTSGFTFEDDLSTSVGEAGEHTFKVTYTPEYIENYNTLNGIDLKVTVIAVNIDIDGNGTPDINIDTDGDGIPDVNIDIDGDGTPDINIDTDGDGIPDVNIDTDGDGKPDLNIDTNGDGIPDINL